MELLQLHENYVHQVHTLVTHLTRQLPQALGARIDPDLFFRAFSRVKEPGSEISIPPSGDAERVSCTPWPTAHTGYTRHPDAPEDDPAMTAGDKESVRSRKKAVADWTDYVVRVSKFIPLIAVQKIPEIEAKRREAIVQGRRPGLLYTYISHYWKAE